MLKTRLCRDLAIDHPILCAPLGGGNAGPELVSAVSDAGGLGLLGMGGLPAPAIREQIREAPRSPAFRAIPSRPLANCRAV